MSNKMLFLTRNEKYDKYDKYIYICNVTYLYFLSYIVR